MADMEKGSGVSILRPRARILRTFGDELISSEIVAVFELVKNAFDADATGVVVKFSEPLEPGKGMIEVIDNGHGMDLDTVRTAWMEPATLVRRKNTTSKLKKRRVLGEKGIGRFAASRLANYLELISRTINEDKEAYAFFDWSQFDDEDKYLDEIEIETYERVPEEIRDGGTIEVLLQYLDAKYFDSADHGTNLRMKSVRTRWGDEEFESLRAELSRLVSPFFNVDRRNANDHFQIFLDLPRSVAQYAGLVEPPEIFKRPHYVIRGTISKTGKYSLWIKMPTKPKAEHIRGSFLSESGKIPTCGPFRVELRIWDRDRDSLRVLAEQAESDINKVRKDLDEGAGISIYRDGFRVLPYGEPRDDWLRLDMRRVQNPTLRLSNNQILGYIRISADTNPELRDQSNREGLIASQAFNDLGDITENILNEVEQRRYKIRPRKVTIQRDRGLFSKLTFTDAHEYVNKKYPEDRKLVTLMNKSAKDIDNRIQHVREVLSRYSRLITLGELIDNVVHDIGSPLGKIILLTQQVLRLMYDAVDGNVQRRSIIQKLRTSRDQSDVIKTVVRRIEPFGGRRRGRPAQIILERVIKDAFDVLEVDISKVKPDLDLPETTTWVTLDPAEIQVVIINLLRNSLYWLMKVPQKDRKIAVVVERVRRDTVDVVFSDSGPGVDDSIRDFIFDPYFTTKPNGIGIGLTISGEIVSDFYDGKLELVTGGPLPGATFRMRFRRRV